MNEHLIARAWIPHIYLSQLSVQKPRDLSTSPTRVEQTGWKCVRDPITRCFCHLIGRVRLKQVVVL